MLLPWTTPTLLLVALLAGSSGRWAAADPAPAADTLAQVYGRVVTRAEAEQTVSSPIALSNAKYLTGIIGKAICQRFAEEEKLEPTDEECQQFNEYLLRSQRADLERASQEVVQLRKEIAAPGHTPEEEAELTEKLRSKELFEKNMGEAVRLSIPASIANPAARQWIFLYKVRKALYAKFGGTVEITKFGPRPAGAEKILLKREIEAGKIVIYDAALAAQVDLLMDAGTIAKPDQIDFSYYWLRPHP